MIIDLLDILNAEGAEKRFSGLVSFGDVSFGGASFLFAPAKAQGIVKNVGEGFSLTATVEGSYKTQCARCAKPVSASFCENISENLTNSGVQKSENAVAFTGTKIDLFEIFLTGVLQNLPMRTLCREDCKGLCPVCGADLNEGDCGCEPDGGGNAFDILKQFKFD